MAGDVGDDAIFIRNFIMNHSMRLVLFNAYVTLKLLAIAETLFTSVITMLKRFKLIKRGLQAMVISEEWCSYKEYDISKATKVKEVILNDSWWDKVDYILSFTTPIYDMFRVYEIWDTMIAKEKSTFYEVIYAILIDRWTRSSTPLHCMAHSLNPRYYSNEWLNEVPNCLAPHRDAEISVERNKCLRSIFLLMRRER
ncbi:Ribonuclease H-like protein [Dioscorea alata]|uniref:Ribonuclease H-like protein n=1 Tax=Dioscorea alata TaxID=55571 RepID=A0ACB7V5X2_DIOAL|nr:Ribonuclease H-like protein [Dioscorea alata]